MMFRKKNHSPCAETSPPYVDSIIMFLEIGYRSLKEKKNQELGLVKFNVVKENQFKVIFPSTRTQEIHLINANKEDKNYFENLAVLFSIDPKTGFILSNDTTENIIKLNELYPEVMKEIFECAELGRIHALEMAANSKKQHSPSFHRIKSCS